MTRPQTPEWHAREAARHIQEAARTTAGEARKIGDTARSMAEQARAVANDAVEMSARFCRENRERTNAMSTRAPRTQGLYRARDGMIFGVCAGLARHLGMSVGAMRVLAVLGALFTSIFPAVIVYVIAALLIKPEPVLPLETDDDEEFYNSYTSSRSMALQRLKRTFDALDRRIQRMEGIVTARDYDWERRLNE